MKYYFACALLALSTSSFAMLCPTNFSNVNIGDSIDYVKQMCGNPSSQKTYKQSSSGAQEWVYYIKTSNFDKATSKMSVIINDGKVVNINIASSGVSNEICDTFGRKSQDPQVIQLACNKAGIVGNNDVATTTACGTAINVGDSSQQLESACGKPIFVNQNQQTNAQTTGDEITEFQYVGSPTVTLIFVNGSLQDRK